MSDQRNGGIVWTNHTWNPIRGCSRVSAGCMNCYAESMAGRFSGIGQPYEGLTTKDSHGRAKWAGKIKLVHEHLEDPLRWKRPRKIFVNSMSDLFHPEVPDEFIDQVFAVMALSPQHIFQVLTKRPERMQKYIGDMHPGSKRVLAIRQATSQFMAIAGNPAWPIRFPLPNVWLGTTVENQETADERIPLLLQTPAAVRWVSMEPLLGPVDLKIGKGWSGYCNMCVSHNCELHGRPDGAICTKSLDWVVVGGESGPHARLMHPDWARSLRDQCAAAGVPFLFKQWGEWAPNWLNDDAGNKITGSEWMDKQGKKIAGRLLDGVQHDGYPDVKGGAA